MIHLHITITTDRYYLVETSNLNTASLVDVYDIAPCFSSSSVTSDLYAAAITIC